MKLYKYPVQQHWPAILERPSLPVKELRKKVRKILKSVRKDGDEALLRLTSKYDGVELSDLAVSTAEIEEAAGLISGELKAAIILAKRNIETFHLSQVSSPEAVETMPGVSCWRKSVAIDSVGLYIPGGSAPLFSTILMLGVPAAIAGCHEVILCSPPSTDGKLHPAILYAADLVGITKIFKLGGVQAIAAMSFGSETIPKVSKIFGPGNQYVTLAKQLVQQYGTAIDMPAGPSEVAVFADESANAAFVAADLLSQAEHGADSQVILVTNSISLVEKTTAAIQEQLVQLDRQTVARQALDNSKIILVHDVNEAMELLNLYAPEHLILNCDAADTLAEKVVNAGSVFIGSWSPESVGDYASGTNHTLPTNGYAKAYSGVSVDSFVKKITFQRLSYDGLKAIGPSVITMAEAEGLDAHAKAVAVRLEHPAS
ncbi:MAG: histidinol dehydrogenase [Chitinophagaceae bacterium]|nr:MAG: histidinol dehydrogenase [Chitinophagaceae bacterium]